MAIAALKIKIMPEGLDINLEEVQKKAEERAMKLGAKSITFNQENIAFGLKALIATIAWPEDKDTNTIETDLSEIEGVSSAQIIDVRRAFG